MSQRYENVLISLFPLLLGGDFEKDIAVDAAAFQELNNRSADVLESFYPDNFSYPVDESGNNLADESGNLVITHNNERIPDWERILGITPLSTDSLDSRRNFVIEYLKLRSRQPNTGILNRQFYVDCAKKLFGIDITLREAVEIHRGSGKLSSSGTTITGSEGTKFTAELEEDFWLAAPDGQLLQVHSIQSDTTLETYGTFSPALSGDARKYRINTYRPAWVGEYAVGDPLSSANAILLWRVSANSAYDAQGKRLVDFLEQKKPANTAIGWVFFVYPVDESGNRLVDEAGNLLITLERQISFLVDEAGNYLLDEISNYITVENPI